MKQPTLMDGARMTVQEAMDLTVQSLCAYGPQHDHWAVAYSGGKDSTTLLTAVVHFIETGRVPRPKRMFVLYGDTRLELPPLQETAMRIMAELGKRDWIVPRVVMAEMDKRFMVYMLGRGVPPPNNMTLRWCTGQIKVAPMEAELRRVAADTPGKLLMLLGVRIGESAMRDRRIALACSRNGAECGQGWYERDLPDALCAKLSPIIHWRTCLVWDWLLKLEKEAKHGFPTELLGEVYGDGGEGSEIEINARTGCCGCPLATRDIALENLLRRREWSYLQPLLGLRPIWRELRKAGRRLRKPPGERRQDGTLSLNQNRLGPLTMDARLWALGEVLSIQSRVNELAAAGKRPTIDILNAEEEARIRELIAAHTWPNKWTGTEPVGDELYVAVGDDGSSQGLLPMAIKDDAP